METIMRVLVNIENCFRSKNGNHKNVKKAFKSLQDGQFCLIFEIERNKLIKKKKICNKTPK